MYNQLQNIIKSEFKKEKKYFTTDFIKSVEDGIDYQDLNLI